MLTADLLRVRDDGKLVTPRYLKLDGKAAARVKERAAGLVAIFQSHQGATRAAINEAIDDLVGDGTDFVTSRGLQKLIEDRCEFVMAGVAPPQEVRELVFDLSAANHPVVQGADALHTRTRADVLRQVGQILEARLAERGEPLGRPITPADVEDSLYGDLDDNQRLKTFRDIDPDKLLERYNLSMAQAALYRARELRVTLQAGSPARYRQLFRTMKFHRLMHRVERQSDGRWLLTVDGPISLLKSTSKYGLQMALFLPALLLCEGWSLEADLAWGPQREPRRFELDDTCGLKSHYKERGVYITEEQEQFEARFRELDSPWTLSRKANIIDLGGRDVLVPDLVFKHKLDGRVAMLEILGFWRKGWLASKAQNLARFGPPNLILALSDRLRTDKNTRLDGLGVNIMTFKGVILPRKVLELIEKVAAPPA